jgi:hypothetical protein
MVKGDTAQRKLLSSKAHLAFYDVDEIKVQKQIKPHTVCQLFKFSACFKFVKTMCSEEVERTVRNIQSLEDNINRRINNTSSYIAKKCTKNLNLSAACELKSPKLIPQHMYWFSELRMLDQDFGCKRM